METLYETSIPYRFRIIRRNFDPNNFVYNVAADSELPDNYVEKVIALARRKTLQINCEDDLDEPFPKELEINPNLFRFTHAVEHLAAAEIVKRSAIADFLLRYGNRTGGIVGLFEFKSPKGMDRFLGFAFYLDISQGREDECKALKSVCRKITRL